MDFIHISNCISSPRLAFSLLSTTASKQWLPIPCRSHLCAFQGCSTSLTRTTWNKYSVSCLDLISPAILVSNGLTSSCAMIGTPTSHFIWFLCTFPRIWRRLNTLSTFRSAFLLTKKSKSSTTTLGFGRYARTAIRKSKTLRHLASS